MKKVAVIAVLVLGLALAAIAADQVIEFTVTIPDAKVAEMVKVINAHPDRIMTLQTNVVDGVTNIVQVVVPEAPRAKFKRITRQQILWYWKDILTRYRVATQVVAEDGIDVDE
jgi:hypothetical protein